MFITERKARMERKKVVGVCVFGVGFLFEDEEKQKKGKQSCCLVCCAGPESGNLSLAPPFKSRQKRRFLFC